MQHDPENSGCWRAILEDLTKQALARGTISAWEHHKIDLLLYNLERHPAGLYSLQYCTIALVKKPELIRSLVHDSVRGVPGLYFAG